MYNFAGTLNTIFVFVSLYGLWLQLRLIWQRRRQQLEHPAERLSLNQFSVTFFAYFSFFVYGFSVQPFNHYMVWPRLCACAIVILILLEIYRDRASWRERTALSVAITALLAGLAGLAAGGTLIEQGLMTGTLLILTVSLLLAQGYWHQIMLIWRNGDTGAVSLKTQQTILMMDFSTVFLAYSMGFEKSWPMLVLAFVSGTTKLIIMGLFRWVRISAEAEKRRNSMLMATT